MEIDVKWWSVIVIVTISLIAILIIGGDSQVRMIEDCKKLRIRSFPQQFFSWNGMVELEKARQYQPVCL